MTVLRRSATCLLVLTIVVGLAACGAAGRPVERAGAAPTQAASRSAVHTAANIDPVWSQLVSTLATTPRWHLTLTREYQGHSDVMYAATVSSAPCKASATVGVGDLGKPSFHQVPMPPSAPVAVPLLRGLIPHDDCDLAAQLASVVHTTGSTATSWTGTFNEDAVRALWRAAGDPTNADAAADSARRSSELSLSVASAGLPASLKLAGSPAVLILTWSVDPRA